MISRLPVLFFLPLLMFCSCFGPFEPFNTNAISGDDRQNSLDPIPNSIVAYWDFNEGQGEAVDNRVSERCEGYIQGCLWDSSGGLDSSSALKFNGISSYVFVRDDTTLNFGTGDFTVSFWIKPEKITGSGHMDIIRKGEDGQGFCISLYRNRIVGLLGSKTISDIDTSNFIFDSTWHNVILCRINSAVSLYLDNYRVQTYDYSGNISNTSPLHIGKGKTESDCYAGLIDEVKIANYGWVESARYTEYSRK
ncbi:MAG: LamG domain-containing protein [Fibrobacter sp.]|nr:LamG domain-containing protein [Fibrobacter sp.]